MRNKGLMEAYEDGNCSSGWVALLYSAAPRQISHLKIPGSRRQRTWENAKK